MASLCLKIANKVNQQENSSQAKTKILERIEKINVLLNDLNIELHKMTREEDNSFVSRTTYDNPLYYYQNIVVLRVVLINPLTTIDILKEIVEDQARIGKKIYESEFKSKLGRI